MKKLFLLLIVVIIAVGVYFGKFEKETKPILNGKLEYSEELEEVKYIDELSTASQEITEKADSSRFIEDAIIYKIWGVKIPLSKEIKKEILAIEQVFQAKAGYRDISIRKQNANYFIKSKGPEILSFEKTGDKVVREEGKWSKTETVKLDSILKELARESILRDSLLGAAEIHFEEYIRNIIGKIHEGKEFEVEFVK